MKEEEQRERRGRNAFDAYNNAVGGVTWDGRPIPPWESLTEKIREAWRCAGDAAANPFTPGGEGPFELGGTGGDT